MKKMYSTVLHKRSFFSRIFRCTFLFLSLLFSLSLLTSSPALANNRETLLQAKKILQVSLHKLNNDVALAAQKISSSGITGDGTRRVLRNLCESNPAIVSCYAADPDGKVLMVEPEKYKDIENMEIGDFGHFKRMKKTGIPQAMQFYESLERLECTSVEYPVFQGKTFQGTLVINVDQKNLVDVPLSKVMKADKTPIWIINTDDTVIFPETSMLYNKNMVKSPPFTFNERFETIARMMNKKSAGEYTFIHDPKDSRKPFPVTFTWDTVNFCGVPWRLVTSHNFFACLMTPDPSLEKEKNNLRYWRDSLRTYFDDRNAEVAKAAKALSGKRLESIFARHCMKSLYSRNTKTVVCCYLTDAAGKIIAVEPPDSKEPDDLLSDWTRCSTQTLIFETPVLIHYVETRNRGFLVFLESPVVKADGTFSGSVGMVIDPGEVISTIAKGAKKELCFILQTNVFSNCSIPMYIYRVWKEEPCSGPWTGGDFACLTYFNEFPEGIEDGGYFPGAEKKGLLNVLLWTTVNCNGITWQIVERRGVSRNAYLKKYPRNSLPPGKPEPLDL